MHTILIAVWLVATGVADASAADSPDTVSSASPAPTVAEILDAWSKRVGRFEHGEIRWTISNEHLNPFGRFESEWANTSGSSGGDIGGTVRFGNEQARYDSLTFSYINFGRGDTHWWTLTEDDCFRQNLARLSQGPAAPQDDRRGLLPYTVFHSPDRWTHLWHGDADEYPRAVILPRDSGDQSLLDFTSYNTDSTDNLSGVPSAELHQLLAAPVLLAFRHLLVDPHLADTEVCEVMDTLKPRYEGHQCIVLRVAEPAKDATDATDESSPPTERLYWLDPSRDFLVVRSMERREGSVLWQIDVHYTQEEEYGWIPSRWSVLVLSKPTPVVLVRQAVTAERTHFDFEPVPESELKATFPPRTWVVDTLTPRQYLVRDDLSVYAIRWPYNGRVLAKNYSDLWADSQGRSEFNFGEVRRAILGLIRWPRAAIPMLMILVAVLLVSRRTARRRNSCENREEVQGSAPPPPEKPQT